MKTILIYFGIGLTSIGVAYLLWSFWLRLYFYLKWKIEDRQDARRG